MMMMLLLVQYGTEAHITVALALTPSITITNTKTRIEITSAACRLPLARSIYLVKRRRVVLVVVGSAAAAVSNCTEPCTVAAFIRHQQPDSFLLSSIWR